MTMSNKIVIDELGRILIPKEIRRRLDIKPQDEVLIYLGEQEILLTKVNKQCVFCDEENMLYNIKGKSICVNCYEELSHIEI